MAVYTFVCKQVREKGEITKEIENDVHVDRDRKGVKRERGGGGRPAHPFSARVAILSLSPVQFLM